MTARAEVTALVGDTEGKIPGVARKKPERTLGYKAVDDADTS
jgi:hypothetical protein